jgi:hypothetical protein
MRCPAHSSARIAACAAALLLGCALAPPAAAHVFLTAPPYAYSDTPVVLTIDWIWGPCDDGPFFYDNVNAFAAGPDAMNVFTIPWGDPGGACTEDPRRYNETAPVPLGILPAGVYTIEVRHEDDELLIASTQVRVYDRPPCTPSDGELCLHGGRFGARVSWEDFAGTTGAGNAVPRDPEVPFLADTGFVWFFDPGNLELMIKVLDGCALNGHYWVFISPGSTVEYSIAVTDHAAGLTRTYANPSGAVPKLFADTSAFPCG